MTKTRSGTLDSDPPFSATSPPADVEAWVRHGVPRGQLSELAGPRSSGCTTLMLQLMAAATRRGELVALVDTFDRLDVTSAVAAGVELDRCLWVRGQATSRTSGAIDGRWIPGAATSVGRPAGHHLEHAIDRALTAVTLVLQAGGFGVVVLDLADVPAATLATLPFTTWLRLRRAVEGRGTACVLVVPAPLVRAAGGLTLQLGGTVAAAAPAGEHGRLTVPGVQGRGGPRRGHTGVASRATVARSA